MIFYRACYSIVVYLATYNLYFWRGKGHLRKVKLPPRKMMIAKGPKCHSKCLEKRNVHIRIHVDAPLYLLRHRQTLKVSKCEENECTYICMRAFVYGLTLVFLHKNTYAWNLLPRHAQTSARYTRSCIFGSVTYISKSMSKFLAFGKHISWH